MKHVAYFGDGEKTFALTMPMIAELERKTGVGIGALYQRVALTLQFHVGDVVEIIRLGLIGGGTTPAEAQSLIDAYTPEQPLIPLAMLAVDILNARWNEPVTEGQDDEPAATGDLAAAIKAAYADVPDV
ncbi:MAG: gene transfer agent family protein [Bosea sp.]|uniref:gene transfer agent family protein n=1 Tax=Bosea sp. (in: a-proteobacteria) TaxID=1871050 RepID=UPI001AD294FD|nr:gene transfer agent family protein [Bosea sp. (in: a-proteobacteria)]MBN9450470.1 gene transfer agent family protein [Bosea sp. (in: a-proteobacteria)]